ATEQIGATAQLELYDFEKNIVVPPNSNAPKHPTTETDPNLADFEFPNLYEAVKFASTRKPECPENACTTNGPTFYLFDKNSHELLAGPATKEKDLKLQQPNQKLPPDSLVLSVP